MALAWKETENPKYLIMDMESMTIISTPYTDEEATREMMRLAFGQDKRVELYESTGFNSWRDKLNK